jgi:hypothetical protein
MKPKVVLLPGLYILSATSLTAGYLLAGAWVILPALLGVGLLFIIARRSSEFQAASVPLVGAFILAAVGVLMGLSFVLLVVGCVGALAGWDLMLFSQTVKSAAKREDISLLERRHDQSLAMAVAIGLLFSLTAANLALSLPFIVILLLCALALGGVYMGLHALAGIEP